ncbi:2',3'-cyclic-nucleotide 2'-phosphodiesterase [Pediococcus damnosus]|uniref:2',3'-cyclic-nucleotide 2'-phosphodiesterase n=1 Tax=Pediococcus damnosus TaxID=51663 RepID=A0ABM6A2Y6_9LACO|nr:bifunctional metallophosphatase/5'-nucleotidase [Pediococcus damnosus]AMV66401.1 2',3'-cyclic-nucleotide 2'-phosphodiesterase [Pediococcus damnosus]KRN53949.1 2,3-cyclic-nucleotide 2-phosphodiesterase [Pediococcus damnosus]PIO80503.1 bifunctional metallophosphatase/5'-nucleotidase [Pediococcus damnosus]GEA93721.1 5'-nucleotidase [Pediococcus damnosus]
MAFNLTLLSTSDVHGFVYPTNFVKRHSNLPFGLLKAASIIENERKKTTDPVLTIDAGDVLEGSPLTEYLAKFSNPSAPQRLLKAYNAIGYDIGVLGNHEFNYGMSYLNAAIRSTDYPMLSANILNDNDEPIGDGAYRILKIHGVRIAILGLTTAYIPFWEDPVHIKGLKFNRVLDTAKRYVPWLRKRADVVIVVYHGGFERDLKSGIETESLRGENVGYELLKTVKGIDALISAHQHRLIATKLFGVPIVQAGHRGAAVGKIVLKIDPSRPHMVVDATAELCSAAKAPVHKKLRAIMSDVETDTQTWLDQPLGQVHGDMRINNPFRARVEESAFIEFIQKVQMAATGTSISATALFNDEATGFGSQITMREVVTNYIYPNSLAVLRVSGADLRAALEVSAKYFTLDGHNQLMVNPKYLSPKKRHYNYDMYEGIDYTLDISKPIGKRVTQLSCKGHTIEANDSFEIVLNKYRAVGGGHYPMFSESKIIRENTEAMSELIADYLQQHPIIEATVNNNFKVIK